MSAETVRKSLQAIVDEGVKELQIRANRLDEMVERARKEVDEARVNMEALIELSKEVSLSYLDRYEHVLIGEVDSPQESRYAEFRVDGYCARLHGLNRDLQPIAPGKLRVLVLVQRVKDGGR